MSKRVPTWCIFHSGMTAAQNSVVYKLFGRLQRWLINADDCACWVAILPEFYRNSPAPRFLIDGALNAVMSAS